MLMNLAELAAYVRDVKPESDVHSNLPNHRSPLEKTMVSMPHTEGDKCNFLEI